MTLPTNDVGARLLLSGRSEFIAGAQESAASMEELGAATKTAGAEAATAGGGFAKLGAIVGIAGSKVRRVAEGLSTVGRRITHFVTLPVLAIGAASIKGATDFSTAMERIHTQAGATQKDVKLLTNQVMQLSTHAQQGPTDLANALYHLKSVGMQNVPAMQALAQASKLAAVSGAPLEDTTNALAAAWKAGIAGARNFGGAVGTLNAIVGAGNMRMSDLIGALGTGILPAAATFHLSLKDVGSALALLVDQGTPATAAATRLRMSFAMMAAPVPTAVAALSKLHLGQFQLANDMRKPNGLIVALGDLKRHMDESGYSQVQLNYILARAFGGGRSSAAILGLLQGYSSLIQKQDQITRSTGKFGDAVKAQLKTPAAQFHLLIAQLEHLGVLIGNALLPPVEKLVHWLGAAVSWFEKLPSGIRKTIGVTLLLVAALGPMLSLLGSAMKMVALIVEAPEILVIGAIAAAVVGLVVALIYAYNHFKGFRDFVKSVWADVSKGASDLWNYLMQIWDAVGKPLFNLIVAAVKLMWALIKPELQIMIAGWKLIWFLIGPYVKDFGKLVLWLARIIGVALNWAADKVNWFTDHWKGLLHWFSGLGGHIKNALKDVGNFLLAPFKWAFNQIADGWDRTIGRISFHLPSWIPGIGGKGFSVPQIPHWKALGGTVVQHSPYIVGENGPELFVPAMSGFIVNNTKTEKLFQQDSRDTQPATLTPTVKIRSMDNARVGNRLPAVIHTPGGAQRPVVIKVYLKQKQIAEAVYDETARLAGYTE